MIRLGLVLALGLAACAGRPPPERAYYLLRAEVPENLSPLDPDALVGVARVVLADYLDRAGVVVQVGENQVREARYHLWAEPLEKSVRMYLHARISTLVGRTLNSGIESQDLWRRKPSRLFRS